MTQESGPSSQELHSTMLVGINDAASATSTDIKDALEKGDLQARAAALQKLIRLHLNGEPQNHMIMVVIKYITPLDDHLIKKLVLYFWEVIDKTDKDGNLLGVIILICSFLRNDLKHPNEYVRGLTLRFVCKLKEKDLVEPLITPVVTNLQDSVAYVRRNAVLAVHAIYNRFPALLPDAPELVETFIRKENDPSARRGAFDVLAAFAPERAAHYLSDLRESSDLAEAGAAFLMSVVNFCHKMIKANPYDKAKYVPVLFSVLQSRSAAVRYQCARTLLSLSTSPTAIRQATLTYVDLLKTQTDNSVRLIVLEQLDGMRERFMDVLQQSLSDVLSALQDSPVGIRSRIVALAVEIVSNKNIDGFLVAMRKELTRTTTDSDGDRAALAAYRAQLVSAVSAALLRFPQCAQSVVPVLMDYICDDSSSSSQVVLLLKEVLQLQPALRAPLLEQLLDMFPLLTSSTVVRSVLWIFTSHAQGCGEVLKVLAVLHQSMAPLPLTPPTVSSAPAAEGAAAVPQVVTTVREDGTYATTYTTVAAVPIQEEAAETSGLRGLICRGDFFLAAALGSTLAKLTAQLFSTYKAEVGEAERNTEQAKAVELLHAVLTYGTTSAIPLDSDSEEHLRLSLALLANPGARLLVDVQSRCRSAFAAASERALSAMEAAPAAAAAELSSGPTSVDAPLIFTQLTAGSDAALEMEAAAEDTTAGHRSDEQQMEKFLKRLEGTVPLSGFSDPIYCEASVAVHGFDVTVDWLLVNRTSQQLTNVTIELASLGGMRLYERPQAYTLEAFASLPVRTVLKVAATEAGIIFGNVLYDAPHVERACVILDDLHVDIMNYIFPARTDHASFRERWHAFEWENKAVVSTGLTSMHAYAELLARELNMTMLEPLPEEGDEAALAAELGPAPEGEGQIEYLSCSMYARTLFGEEVLLNISVEQNTAAGAAGNITGMVRIRSGTSGVVHGVGEKIKAVQAATW